MACARLAWAAVYQALRSHVGRFAGVDHPVMDEEVVLGAIPDL
jgi:hypothetical protein